MTVLNIHVALHTFLINLQISSVATSIHVSLHFGCTFNISIVVPQRVLDCRPGLGGLNQVYGLNLEFFQKGRRALLY